MLATEFHGRTYTTTARRLMDVMKAVKADPAIKVNVDWCTTWTATEARAWFMQCLNAKINRNTPMVGRKYADDWQNNMRNDVRTVNDYHGRRLRSTGSRGLLRTPELRRRYPNVNDQREEWAA